ncbi:PAS domain S-box protein [Methanoculleus bourgensis]|uniref:PAS domain-containing protein n=1 Tax=Methanoculleus bourgensis TaxID=83986 RepID=UPI003B953686
MAHLEESESTLRARSPDREVYERIDRLLVENETLRRENAALQAVEDALRESEERYRRLFEDDLTGDVVVAPDGLIIACNPAFAKILGFASSEEAHGTDVRDLFEDPGEFDRIAATLRSDGKMENVGRRRRRRDGTRIYVVENVVGRFSADGELLEIRAYVYDDSERKRAEEALRENMEWYRQALDNPLIGYAYCEIVADAAGTPIDFIYREVNRAFEHFTGVTREDVVNRRVTEFLPADEAAGIIAKYGTVALTGKPTAFQYHVPALAKWFEVTAFSHRRGYVTTFFTDITERKRVEEALRESEERYRRLFEEDLTGHFLTTADGRIIACNTAFVRMFGFASREEALGTNIRDLYDDPHERDALLARLQWGGKVENEGRIRKRRDGTLIHVVENIVGRFGEDGRLLEIQGYVYDDSERTRAEDALRESEERFRAVLENSLDAAYRRNLQTDRYDYMSPVIEEILGFTPGEMIVMSTEKAFERIHPDDRRAVGAELNAAVASGRGLLSYRFLAKNGEYRWLEDHLMVIRDSGGRPLYLGGIVRDVTARKEAEAELARVHRDLASAHREANLYLDILTHDIGNTENVSNLYAELLLEMLDGEAAACAANLKRSITKSIEILGLVSKIRRIHAGPPALRPTEIDAVIRTEIAHFPVVPISYEGASCKVVADDLLCEVFTNLIGNAVKHGGPGVAVTIRVDEQNGEVRVTVADTGRGVPDDQKEEIFHRYERRQRGVGEGLGLYLVQILIDRYGGRIWVEDRVPGHPGEGAAFVFLLRKAEGEGTGQA